MSKTVVTFGEIMARFMPPGHLRLRQVMPGTLEVTFGGSEANVAASICMLGGSASFVTTLPDNVLTDACIGDLRSLGVETGHVQRSKRGRLGLYFVETGANQRPSQVVYDREGAAVAVAEPDSYDWAKIFKGAGWFHVSGITPAVSAKAAEAAIQAAGAAKQAGLTVSCDLNFRKKLWGWHAENQKPRDLAEQVMRKLLVHVDVLIANEEDCADVLGVKAEGSNIDQGKLAVDRYPQVARGVCSQFANIKLVAITLRQSISADHNLWGAMLYDAKADTAHMAPCDAKGAYAPYSITDIVDRVGGGDSFAAGLIFALNDEKWREPAQAVHFAVASSCLAHSIKGDFNYVTRSEVERLVGGSASGRVVR